MCDTTFNPVSVPFHPDYHAKLDTSDLCSPSHMSRYCSLLGSANWMITIGRFDINYVVNTLAQYCVAPCLGHLQALQCIFGYLKLQPRDMLLIENYLPSCQNQAIFHRNCDWSKYFPGALKDVPTKAPPPFGETVHLTAYVDADHAHDNVTRQQIVIS